MSYQSLGDRENLWYNLYEAGPCQLLNVTILPLIFENLSINDILKKIFKDLEKIKESKQILSRLKLLELMINNKNISIFTIKNILFNKYYRNLYKLYINNTDPIIRLTLLINFFKKICSINPNKKFIKYYKLIKDKK